MIPCATLPEGVVGGEGAVARRENLSGQYKVLYTAASVFTTHDIAGTLMDLFRLTSERRYLDAAGALIDQFFEHGEAGRPATMYTEGRWARADSGSDLSQVKSFVSDDVSQAAWMLAFLALEHDALTETDRHRRWMVDWARAVDEDNVADDQMMSPVLVAAHDYEGDPRLLARVSAMALRTAAVVEGDDRFHQCSAPCRQGSKAMMETLYQPLLGACDWGTRGGMPFGGLRHETGSRRGLPAGTAFRVWNTRGHEWRFHARNSSSRPAVWKVSSERPGWRLDRILIPDGGQADAGEVRLAPGQTRQGAILWAPEGA